MSNLHFKIVIPFWNVERWIAHNINALLNQSYKNFECLLIDDCSTDKSYFRAKDLIADDARFSIIKNISRQYALKNTVCGFKHLEPDDEDVLVIIDGDDWLYSAEALETVAYYYDTYQCWLTYGSYKEHPSGNRGVFCRQVSDEVIERNAFRDVEWMTSHLRTFKTHLFNKVKRIDLIDVRGDFFTVACDSALMFPMLEMSGYHSCFIEDILYTYNLSNVHNHHKRNQQLQIQLSNEVRQKVPRQRI